MRSLWSPRFTGAEMLFSAKCFASAMLAMYVASRAGLPRPFWALITAYVVANPLAGAVRSKALYRFLGTVMGSAATLLLVPSFVAAPELLTLALALWVALCLFVSLLDRTPRSYVLMLAGYSAALIGFPAVDAPQSLFETASARVEEIGIGILCATLVHSLVFPVGMAGTIVSMIDKTLADARAWMRDVVAVVTTGEDVQERRVRQEVDRRRLAADITQLRLLSTHVPFDTGNLKWTAAAVRALQDRVAALMPAVSAVEDRLAALCQSDGALPEDVARVSRQVLDRVSDAQRPIGLADIRDADEEAALRAAIACLVSPARDADVDGSSKSASAASPWQQALRTSLAVRLEELLEEWTNCCRLRARIDDGLRGQFDRRAAAEDLVGPVLHRDVGMALWSALAAALATCLCAAFWILTGWPGGSAMTMMAAVFCCFFAGMDDPTPAIYSFLNALLLSTPLAAIYVLVLFPLIGDFFTLALVCAPACLVLGAYMARPAAFLASMAMLLAGVLGSISLHDTGQLDFVNFANSMIGQYLGVGAAAVITALVRSVGAQWSARRIQQMTWRELGRAAAAVSPADHRRYAVRVLDRVGLLAPRIAQAGGTLAGVNADDALIDLRIGADLHALQRHRAELPAPLAEGILGEVERLFREHPRFITTMQAAQARPRLAALLDEATGALLSAAPASARQRRALAALVGLRRNLFPMLPWGSAAVVQELPA